MLVITNNMNASHDKEEKMETKEQNAGVNAEQGMAAKAVRWVVAGAAILLIGFTIYSAVMRKFGGG